jgi:GTP-binding protein HflX
LTEVSLKKDRLPTAKPTDSDGPEISSGRALVLHPDPKQEKGDSRTAQSRLEEAVGLAQAIDLEVVGQEVITLARMTPSALFGSGVVDRLAGVVMALEVAVVVVNRELSPVQQRNLERAFKCKVIDRTGLILEIFGARARTREGQMQVELAHLSYQRSRLVRSWTHLERQRGGAGFMGGPGERQIELDRRLIDERITALKRDLEKVKRTRSLHRDARKRVPYPVVALVGYTNAGKSTLFNRLTESSVFAKDLLFATLDPTMRRIALPSGREMILSDTVGFISDLPTTLVAAFRATLEEVLSADIILHVRDVSHLETEAQREDVHVVMRELGLDPGDPDLRMIEVLNKIDLLSEAERQTLSASAARRPDLAMVSAATGEGLDALLARIDGLLGQGYETLALDLPLTDGQALAWLYEHGEVKSRDDEGEISHLEVALSSANLERFRKMRPELVNA